MDSRPLKIFLIGPPDEHNSPTRRFPPLWSVEETEACFIVRDADGRALTVARETEGEWNKARPRRSLFDMDQKALVLRSPAAR